jgi:hypothetical protein
MDEKVKVDIFSAPENHITDDPEEWDKRQGRQQTGQRKHGCVGSLALSASADSIALH